MILQKMALIGATCATLLCAEQSTKPTILLVAFGSSFPETKISFETIEKETKERFPNYSVQWAYTSQMIRKKLAKRGTIIDSPEEALKKLHKSGTPSIHVQSLHTVAGHEYGEVVKAIEAVSNEHKIPTTFGKPLLYTYDDLVRVKEALFSVIPKKRKKKEAVIFMGHGNGHHPSDYSYVALTHLLEEEDPLVFMSTVEDIPSFDSVLKKCKKAGVKKVWLHPFMSVAGDHARNDMSGPDDDSWVSQLKAHKIKSESILRGTGEYPQFVSIWLDHLEASMSEK